MPSNTTSDFFWQLVGFEAYCPQIRLVYMLTEIIKKCQKNRLLGVKIEKILNSELKMLRIILALYPKLIYWVCQKP